MKVKQHSLTCTIKNAIANPMRPITKSIVVRNHEALLAVGANNPVNTVKNAACTRKKKLVRDHIVLF